MFRPQTPDTEGWLNSHERWNDELLSKGDWRGVKFLGRGAFGRVGLWENIQDPSKKVVVKQSASYEKGLQRESKFLEVLTAHSSTHVIKLLQPYYIDVGQGTDDQVDPLGNPVARIYIEYCENDNMYEYAKTIYERFPSPLIIPEEILWRILQCLCKGLCAFSHGNEEVDGPSWDHPPIVHNDLKMNNILVGSTDEGEHKTEPIYIIADLGEAVVDEFADPYEDLEQVVSHILVLIKKGDFHNFSPAKEILDPLPYSSALKKVIMDPYWRGTLPTARSLLKDCEVALSAFGG